MYVCVLPTTRSQQQKDFAIQTAFDRQKGMWRVRITKTCYKKVPLRRYGSINGLVVLRHLELQTSAEKSQKLTMLFHSQCH